MRRLSLLLIPLLLLIACGEAPDERSVDEFTAALDASLRSPLQAAATSLREIIRDPQMDLASKHREAHRLLREVGPTIRERAASALAVSEGRDLGPHGAQILQLLHMAQTLGDGAAKLGAPEPSWRRFEGPYAYYEDPWSPALPTAVQDKFWLFYHWTEILGGLYDDADYAWVFADSGRTGFIAQEAGASGIEQFHDWWQVSRAVWDDPSLSDNQRLMAAKYTMWQNDDWGGGNHYINEWWSWEAAYKEEDCALFTGNNMAALAALYELTRDPRTLARLRAMFEAIKHYDRFTVDDPDPLALEDPDGRITRGTKTRNLYLADEMNIFDIEITPGGIVTHHNNSWPDHYTGRERKNVSRDQYYGVLLGYRTLWEALTGLDERTAAEQALLDDLVAHTRLITDYIFGQSNLHWDWGWEYMLYALFEGSCANPPNFTFMMFFGHVGLEEMTGEQFTQFDTLQDLGESIFAFGRGLGLVAISEALFEPAHTGLTALNQYLSGFYLSDIDEADWLFLWPPELLRDANAGRRRLWRRVVAAFYRKYGVLGSPEYMSVAAELFDETLNERPTVQRLFNSYQGDYAKLEPQGVGLEDFMLPLALLASRAANRDELAALLATRYAELIADGSLDFADTDLPYAEH